MLGAVTGASSTNTITIRPASGTSSALSLTTSASSNTITIDGGSYYTIDGRPGGSGSNKYITLETSNSATPTAATVTMLNDATNNVIKYCTIKGTNSSSAGGVVEITTTTATTGNDNDTVDHCDMTASGTTKPYSIVYASGTSAKTNDNCAITNCNISDFTNVGTNISDYNGAWLISGNSVFQTTSVTTNDFLYGIYVGYSSGASLSDFIIKNNYIGGSAAQCGSTALTMTGAGSTTVFKGIYLNANSSGANNTIQNNTIANISISTTYSISSGAFVGITVGTGSGSNNVSDNIIGNATGNSITVNNANVSSSNIYAMGIYYAAGGANSITNNTVAGLTTTCSTVGSPVASIIGINAAGGTATISGNTVGGNTANSITASTASTGVQTVAGILSSVSSTISNNNVGNLNNSSPSTSLSAYIQGIKVTSGNQTITGNTVHDLSTALAGASTGANASMVGISLNSSAGTHTVSNNKVYNLKNTAASGNNTMYGIVLNGTTSATNIADGNLITSLAPTSATAITTGMFFNGGNYTVSNNMLRLGIDSLGNSITNGNNMAGISENSGAGANNIFHNSVYIGGTGVNGSGTTRAFLTTQNTTRSIVNNIFVNNRSNSGTGTGKHYAIGISNTSASNTTLSNNIYQFTGTGGILGALNSTDYTTLASWQGVVTDANSLNANPGFLNATGTTANVNLHLGGGTPAESAGATGTGITTDFDGQTRSGLTPVDVGADADNFVNYVWSGATNTAWTTGSNWTGSYAPNAAGNVSIPGSLTNYPNITTGTQACNNITINSTASLTVSGGTLQIGGNITNSGTVDGTGGTVELNGSTAQTIQAGTFKATNLTLNNSNGATITSGMVNVLGVYTPTSGVLTTGGFLTLKSTSLANTARIAAGSSSGGYISGNITVERFIPGKRAFRFLAHPFTSSIALSQITDNIDITGAGGATNGFTSTTTNNPSAFTFDVSTGDNSTTGNNPGWAAFTSAITANWAQYQAARILVRGAKGEGLTGAAYTPSDVTLDMTGAVNQGDQTISLTKGTSTSFVLAGNPFPCPVDMDAAITSNTGSAFYIWDATAGTRGAYTSYSFGTSSFVLPSCASFVTTVPTTSGSITFAETSKSTGTPGSMLKGSAYTVQLRLEDSTTFWDRLLLHFDDNAMATVDYPDAPKLYNPDMTFYTWSKDDSMLSIDTRPYVQDEVIKLGLYSTLQKSFKIVTTDFNIPTGTQLYLHDKYLNTTKQLNTGVEYWFTVTADTASWGNNRFELNTQGNPTGTFTAQSNTLKVKLVPNPATADATLYYEGLTQGNVNIVVSSMTGTIVQQSQQYTTGNGSVSIASHSLASGVYLVTVENNGIKKTQKLIKQ